VVGLVEKISITMVFFLPMSIRIWLVGLGACSRSLGLVLIVVPVYSRYPV
jgi:hypothetical protein